MANVLDVNFNTNDHLLWNGMVPRRSYSLRQYFWHMMFANTIKQSINRWIPTKLDDILKVHIVLFNIIYCFFSGKFESEKHLKRSCVLLYLWPGVQMWVSFPSRRERHAGQQVRGQASNGGRPAVHCSSTCTCMSDSEADLPLSTGAQGRPRLRYASSGQIRASETAWLFD